MTLEQLKEIIRTTKVQNTMFMGGAIVVHGVTGNQLHEIFLLAQARLESLAQPQNPS